MGRPRLVSDVQKAEIVRRYIANESRNSLAVEFGISRWLVTDLVRRQNGHVRGPSEASKLHNRFPVNDFAFDDAANNSDAAYWVGFLMTDGCISVQRPGCAPHIIIAISAVDRVQLESFRTFLHATHSIQEIPATTNRHGIRSAPGVRLDISSERLAAVLATYGVVQRKTSTATVIGLDNDRNFWRGAIDGDGNLRIAVRTDGPYKPKPILQFCGSKSLVAQFAAFAQRHVGAAAQPHQDKRGKDNWAIGLTCGPAVAMIRHLYSDCSVALPRKLAKAREILDRFG